MFDIYTIAIPDVIKAEIDWRIINPVEQNLYTYIPPERPAASSFLAFFVAYHLHIPPDII